ncbi:hypothetical protein BJV82DRAFT_715151, partial [Fennellomyces sp. T-0311]
MHTRFRSELRFACVPLLPTPTLFFDLLAVASAVTRNCAFLCHPRLSLILRLFPHADHSAARLCTRYFGYSDCGMNGNVGFKIILSDFGIPGVFGDDGAYSGAFDEDVYGDVYDEE